MSKESLEEFIQKVTDSEELQARIGEEIDGDALIALGAEHGCEFCAEDLAADAELSDEQLEAVAGGLVVLAAFALKGPKIGGEGSGER
ncbi:MAG TPA: Nif11-like leader peptide family natural product precursor, partial [Gemmatimonadetes bacterium]|nr:Nif11-like leader peptide family natural product precursor [Gemmatimonadota bacterium]